MNSILSWFLVLIWWESNLPHIKPIVGVDPVGACRVMARVYNESFKDDPRMPKVGEFKCLKLKRNTTYD